MEILMTFLPLSCHSLKSGLMPILVMENGKMLQMTAELMHHL